MKFATRALGVGLAAIMAAGSYSILTAAEGGAPPVLQPVITKIEPAAAAPAAPEGTPADAAVAPVPGAGEQVGGPAIGGPAAGGPEVGGPAVGGPAIGGPAIGGPAIGGPVVGGPAVIEGPALLHHFVYTEMVPGYGYHGKAFEIRMELLLFADGGYKMLAPEHGYGAEGKMGEWLGAWHLDDDVLMIEYKHGGDDTGFITVAKEGLRLRMNGHRWVDILTVK